MILHLNVRDNNDNISVSCLKHVNTQAQQEKLLSARIWLSMSLQVLNKFLIITPEINLAVSVKGLCDLRDFTFDRPTVDCRLTCHRS